VWLKLSFEGLLSALDRESEQPENANVNEESSVIAREEGIEVNNAAFVYEFSSCIEEESEVNL
jgi:hypothetical protein